MDLTRKRYIEGFGTAVERYSPQRDRWCHVRWADGPCATLPRMVSTTTMECVVCGTTEEGAVEELYEKGWEYLIVNRPDRKHRYHTCPGCTGTDRVVLLVTGLTYRSALRADVGVSE